MSVATEMSRIKLIQVALNIPERYNFTTVQTALADISEVHIAYLFVPSVQKIILQLGAIKMVASLPPGILLSRLK